MPSLQTAFLCNAASPDANGLVSVLGGFVDKVSALQLPVRSQIWLVARVVLDEADRKSQHVVVIQVDHTDGTEQVLRVEGTQPPQMGDFDPDLPVGALVILPMALEFRRVGLYNVSLIVDGDRLWECPLKVETQLPQL
jgi:hypothetical protein